MLSEDTGKESAVCGWGHEESIDVAHDHVGPAVTASLVPFGIDQDSGRVTPLCFVIGCPDRGVGEDIRELERFENQ